MIKLQIARWGEDWQATPNEWPSEWMARQAVEKESFEELVDLVAEGRFWYRLVDESGKVLEIWQCLPYIGSPYLLPINDNPFSEIQEAYGLSDEEMIDFCQRYLKAKGQ